MFQEEGAAGQGEGGEFLCMVAQCVYVSGVALLNYKL